MKRPITIIILVVSLILSVACVTSAVDPACSPIPIEASSLPLEKDLSWETVGGGSYAGCNFSSTAKSFNEADFRFNGRFGTVRAGAMLRVTYSDGSLRYIYSDWGTLKMMVIPGDPEKSSIDVCQPLPVEVVELLRDDMLDWKILGPTGSDYMSCSFYTWAAAARGLHYGFRDLTGSVDSGDMLRATFSDGTIRYFYSDRGNLMMAMP